MLTESGPGTEVTEDIGDPDFYDVSLQTPSTDVDVTTVLYLTVSAVSSSSFDKRLNKRAPAPGDTGGPHDAESVEISLVSETGPWVPAGVLRFDSTNWDDSQRVWVRPIHDDAIEGERKVMVSHSIIVESDDDDDIALFQSPFSGETLPVPNIEVRVLDDDLGSALITETDGETRVLEGVAGRPRRDRRHLRHPPLRRTRRRRHDRPRPRQPDRDLRRQRQRRSHRVADLRQLQLGHPANPHRPRRRRPDPRKPG